MWATPKRFQSAGFEEEKLTRMRDLLENKERCLGVCREEVEAREHRFAFLKSVK